MANLAFLDTDNNALAARTCAIIQNDPVRMRCLEVVREKGLPDWFIAAGFVRNAIWDSVHGYRQSTPLNDVDVVYFDDNAPVKQDGAIQRALSSDMPQVNWEVKNQARMHVKHDHAPYRSSAAAIARWIEMPTCVGVRLSREGVLRVLAPYGLTCCFSLRVCINPAFPNKAVYCDRVSAKQWQQRWPQLDIEFPS